jgi:hypothetical protein
MVGLPDSEKLYRLTKILFLIRSRINISLPVVQVKADGEPGFAISFDRPNDHV